MLEVTTIGSYMYAGSQALGEVCHYLVDVLLWHLFPDGLQSDFYLVHSLESLEFMVHFEHGSPYLIVHWVHIWRVRAIILLNEPSTVRLQPVLRDVRRVSRGAGLLQD